MIALKAMNLKIEDYFHPSISFKNLYGRLRLTGIYGKTIAFKCRIC